MTSPLRLGHTEGLDLAIELTKRLDEAAGASLVDIESTNEATTVQLSIPAGGFQRIRTMRRRLWTSLVSRNVAGRKALLLETARASGRRRASAARATRRVERSARFLAEHDGERR